MATPKQWKPSAAGIAMLENVATGISLHAGLIGRSQHGGAVWTRRALLQHSLMEYKPASGYSVTTDGYEAIAKARRQRNEAPEKP